jgi:hypothetical protein
MLPKIPLSIARPANTQILMAHPSLDLDRWQYDYLTLPPGNDQYIYNPYAKLIHSPSLLNSIAHAFSAPPDF